MWRDSADRRPHFAVLLSLLAALVAAVTLAPAAAGTIGFFDEAGPISLLSPSLTGDPRVGGTLTCTRGTWDDSDAEPYETTYEWFQNDTRIDTGATHTVDADDVDEPLECVVTAHDRWREGRADSNAFFVSGPQSLTAPALSGDDRLGGELTCTRGTWDDRGLPAPYPVSYAWLRDGDPIAEGAAYTVTRDDAGTELTCEVTAADTSSAPSGSAFPDGPRNGTRPAISGDLRVGGTVSCSPGAWDGTYTLTYAWLRDGDPIPLAAAATYRVDPLDVGEPLSCTVTAEDLTVAESTAETVVAPISRALPTISGERRIGDTLTCDGGRWDGAYDLTYAWTRNGAAAGTGTQYAVTAADAGQSVACVVTAQGLTPATRTAFIPGPQYSTGPSVAGTPRVGRTLTCSPAGWDGTYTLATEWYAANTRVATTDEYTVTAADVGKLLSCRVIAAGLTTASSLPRTVPAPRALVAPAISGDPSVGSALTCRRGTWDELASAPYATTYAWERDGAAIAGQTQSTLVADAAGGYRCAVTVLGGAATEVSAPVTVTAGATGSGPFITGTPKIGGTLTCDPGTRTGAITWERNGAASGTGATRAVTVDDRALALACVVAGVRSPAVTVLSPVSEGAPQISGIAKLGGTLTCVAGPWDGDYPIVFTWFRGATQIGTAATYSVTGADAGQELTCRTMVADVAYAEAVTTVAVPANLGRPTVTGDPALGATLTCAPGQWDVTGTRTYAWLRNGQPAGGGTTIQADAIGAQFACQETLAGQTAVSDAVTVRVPANRTKPTISGTPRLKEPLTCGPGTWDGTYTFTYRWLHESTQLATGATYTPTAPGELTCEVTAAGTTTATTDVEVSEPRTLLPPSISGGEPRIGTVLTCTPGRWDGTYALTYAWTRDNAAAGSTQTYTVSAQDVDSELACTVEAEGLTTAGTPSVFPRGPQALTAPALSGDPILRGSLRCSTGTWDGDYALTYRWFSDGNEIPGQTGTAYAITRADLEHDLSCSVTAADMTEAESDATTIESPHLLDGGLSIEGQRIAGRVVTCGGRWNDREGLRYQVHYQWYYDFERFVPIPDADKQTYLLSSADVGLPLHCLAVAEGGFEERSGSIHAEWEALGIFLKADDDSVDPGAGNGYTVTVRNPNGVEKASEQLEVTLPTGFAYVPGSTLPAGEPTVLSGGRLRWSQRMQMTAYGEFSLHFLVTGTQTVGHHYAGAWVDPDGYDIRSSSHWDAARITVEAPATCTITGTPGPDVLVGTDGNDVICGLGGNDRISGGAGDDTILGGDGDDVLDGGLGADTLRGGGGLDTVNYSDRTTPVSVTVGDPTKPDGTPAVDDPPTPSEGDDVDADVEIVRGGRGNDFLSGSYGDQELYGGAGNDRLNGGDGDDLLDGGAGNDWLEAPDGRVDRYQCGAGEDTFERDDLDRVSGCEHEFFNPVVG